MSYAYAQRKKADAKTPAAQNTSPERMEALQSGAVKPSAAEMGHRVDLPEAMRAKMENSFGADLSAVRLYESQSVADAGAEAITQGSNIAFAPGKLDFSSEGGQALLGHELSHVVSQQRGEVTGGGFLNDSALEARADREGAMAARGESVYGGAAAPLSTASAAPAAGPMQAKRWSSRQVTKDALRAAKSRVYGDASARMVGDYMDGGDSGQFIQTELEAQERKRMKNKKYAQAHDPRIDLAIRQAYAQQFKEEDPDEYEENLL